MGLSSCSCTRVLANSNANHADLSLCYWYVEAERLSLIAYKKQAQWGQIWQNRRLMAQSYADCSFDVLTFAQGGRNDRHLRYVTVASTPPAAPPAINDTSGDLGAPYYMLVLEPPERLQTEKGDLTSSATILKLRRLYVRRQFEGVTLARNKNSHRFSITTMSATRLVERGEKNGVS